MARALTERARQVHGDCAQGLRPVSASAGSDRVTVSYTGAGGSACPAGTLSHPSRGGGFVLEGGVASNATIAFDARGRSAGGTIALAGGETVVVESGTGYVHR